MKVYQTTTVDRIADEMELFCRYSDSVFHIVSGRHQQGIGHKNGLIHNATGWYLPPRNHLNILSSRVYLTSRTMPAIEV